MCKFDREMSKVNRSFATLPLSNSVQMARISTSSYQFNCETYLVKMLILFRFLHLKWCMYRHAYTYILTSVKFLCYDIGAYNSMNIMLI